MPQLLEHGIRQDLTGREVAPAPQFVVDGVEPDACGARHLEPFGDHLGPDPVAADDGDVLSVTHWSNSSLETKRPPTMWTVGRAPRRQPACATR
jgi:hypothetical protein